MMRRQGRGKEKKSDGEKDKDRWNKREEKPLAGKVRMIWK